MSEIAVPAEPIQRARLAAPSSLRSLRAVVRRGLLDHRRAPLTWGLPLGALCALIVAMYPSIADSLKTLTQSYPQGLKEAFNIKDLDTVEAYLDAEMFSLIVPLAVGFFAIRSISHALSVPEERVYLDTTLAAPISRRVLVAGSFIVAALASVAVLLVVFALTMIADIPVGTGLSSLKTAAGVANVWALAVFFAGVAVLDAGFLHRSAAVTATAAGTLVGMYVIDLVGKIAEPLEPFRALTAFKYYGSGLTDGMDPLAFAGLTTCGALLAFAGMVLFERRDVLA